MAWNPLDMIAAIVDASSIWPTHPRERIGCMLATSVLVLAAVLVVLTELV